jgi:hypothetical protein
MNKEPRRTSLAGKLETDNTVTGIDMAKVGGAV